MFFSSVGIIELNTTMQLHLGGKGGSEGVSFTHGKYLISLLFPCAVDLDDMPMTRDHSSR